MSNPWGSFQVSTNILLPLEEDDRRIKTTEIFRSHAEAINRREISSYDSQETSTGQQWPALEGQNDQRRRVPQRMIVPITLASSTSPQSFPHGLTPTGYLFTLINGVIGNGVDAWLPLPYPGTDQVLLMVDATNVVITTSTTSFAGYTGYVVLEYLKN